VTVVALAFFLVPLALLIGLAIAAKTTSGIAAMLTKCLATVAALPMLAFYTFGFLASFEGSDYYFWGFRVLYVVLFLVVSATVVYVWLPSRAVATGGRAVAAGE